MQREKYPELKESKHYNIGDETLEHNIYDDKNKFYYIIKKNATQNHTHPKWFRLTKAEFYQKLYEGGQITEEELILESL